MRGSYTIAPNIDAFLAQVVRLAGNGYYFYFRGELKPSKDPLKLDAKLIREWQLDQPYWKREKRRRGAAPKHLVPTLQARLPSNRNARPNRRWPSSSLLRGIRIDALKDIRKNAIYFCGYSIRYPISKGNRSPENQRPARQANL